jgi:glucosyl-dolichyl phosphate glucuronosyltransferase
MKISSIICTRNRASYLPRTIRSLAQQQISPNEYEIIVVDNGSTDATQSVVADLSREIANLRYVHEPGTGLSAARNRGLNEAGAPIVAFLDDDAIASPQWLYAILKTLNAVEPSAAGVGGPVEPWWEIPKPRWFPLSLLGCHYRHYGDQPRWYNYPAEQPIGCNMAFRKEWCLQLGGFNPLLEKYNDDTEFLQRLAVAGGKIFYQPEVAVQHLVQKNRLSIGWQMRRYYREGFSLGILRRQTDTPARTVQLKQVGRQLVSIGKRAVRVIVSRGSLADRMERVANLSLLVGETVYLTKSLRER